MAHPRSSPFPLPRCLPTSKPQVAVCVFAFDCLSLNGRTLLREPLTARREALYSALNESEGHLQFATEKVGGGTPVGWQERCSWRSTRAGAACSLLSRVQVPYFVQIAPAAWLRWAAGCTRACPLQPLLILICLCRRLAAWRSWPASWTRLHLCCHRSIVQSSFADVSRRGGAGPLPGRVCGGGHRGPDCQNRGRWGVMFGSVMQWWG